MEKLLLALVESTSLKEEAGNSSSRSPGTRSMPVLFLWIYIVVF